MREATRQRLINIKPGYDLVIIARQPIRLASYAEIECSLEQLLEKANLWRPHIKTEAKKR
jgi:ribonuclease P protein component